MSNTERWIWRIATVPIVAPVFVAAVVLIAPFAMLLFAWERFKEAWFPEYPL